MNKQLAQRLYVSQYLQKCAAMEKTASEGSMIGDALAKVGSKIPKFGTSAAKQAGELKELTGKMTDTSGLVFRKVGPTEFQVGNPAKPEGFAAIDYEMIPAPVRSAFIHSGKPEMSLAEIEALIPNIARGQNQVTGAATLGLGGGVALYGGSKMFGGEKDAPVQKTAADIFEEAMQKEALFKEMGTAIKKGYNRVAGGIKTGVNKGTTAVKNLVPVSRSRFNAEKNYADAAGKAYEKVNGFEKNVLTTNLADKSEAVRYLGEELKMVTSERDVINQALKKSQERLTTNLADKSEAVRYLGGELKMVTSERDVINQALKKSQERLATTRQKLAAARASGNQQNVNRLGDELEKTMTQVKELEAQAVQKENTIKTMHDKILGMQQGAKISEEARGVLEGRVNALDTELGKTSKQLTKEQALRAQTGLERDNAIREKLATQDTNTKFKWALGAGLPTVGLGSYWMGKRNGTEE